MTNFEFYNPPISNEPYDLIRNPYGGYTYFPEFRNTLDYYRANTAAQNSMAERTAADNELAKAAEWAQHLNPATTAGMLVGNILGKVLTPTVAEATQNWGNKFRSWVFGNKKKTPTPEQQEQNRNKLNEWQNDLLQTQNNMYNKAGVPAEKRTYQTPLGNTFGADVYDNYYNPTAISKDFTTEQMWNTPQKNESIIDYNNRVNPAWDWRKNISLGINYNPASQPSIPANNNSATQSDFNARNYEKWNPFALPNSQEVLNDYNAFLEKGNQGKDWQMKLANGVTLNQQNVHNILRTCSHN